MRLEVSSGELLEYEYIHPVEIRAKLMCCSDGEGGGGGGVVRGDGGIGGNQGTIVRYQMRDNVPC